MANEPCKGGCFTIKRYGDEYHCMECYRKFTPMYEEDSEQPIPEPVQSTSVEVAPALKRIEFLEGELLNANAVTEAKHNLNLTLIKDLEAAQVSIKAMKDLANAISLPEPKMAYGRPVSGGMLKNSETGEVTYPTTEDLRDIPKDLGDNRD